MYTKFPGIWFYRFFRLGCVRCARGIARNPYQLIFFLWANKIAEPNAVLARWSDSQLFSCWAFSIIDGPSHPPRLKLRCVNLITAHCRWPFFTSEKNRTKVKGWPERNDNHVVFTQANFVLIPPVWQQADINRLCDNEVNVSSWKTRIVHH